MDDDELFTHRIGDLLFIYDKDGDILGCFKDKIYLDPHQFDIEMKMEASKLRKDLAHARSLKERMEK